MKKLTTELAAQITERIFTSEIRDAVEATLKAADSDTGTFRMVITTENVDRYQEVIKLDGWELEHYLKNPVVLWGHNHNIIVAVTTSLQKIDGQLVAEGKFAPTAEGQEKRKLYDFGFLRASSVGFLEKEREGNLITKAELIEWSFVSVPANPYALSLAMEKDLNINELVTKGLMTLIKEAEPVQEEAQAAVLEDPVITEVPAEEKKFSTKAVTPIIDQLKGIVSALEALETEEPERTEDDEPVVETEEEKAFRKFNESRKAIQEFATLVGEVLADARRIKEAQK